MKPFKHVRKGEHYCCEMCDGPFSKYKKIQTKKLKKTEKSLAKKDINKQLEDT